MAAKYMRKVILQIPDDPRLLVAVAHVALRHSQLLYVLRLAMKLIDHIDHDQALNATRKMGAAPLFKHVRQRAYLRFGPGAAFEGLRDLLDRAETITGQRNRLIHDVWATTKDGTPVIRDDVTSNLKQLPTPSELEALADDIARLTSEINGARLKGFLHKADLRDEVTG